MRAIAAIAAPLLLLAIAACDGGASLDVNAPCTNEATAEAMRTAIAATRGAGDDALPDDEYYCRLRRALLTLADMPDGWIVAPVNIGSTFGDRIFVSRSAGEDCSVGVPGPYEGLRATYWPDDESAASFVRHDIFAMRNGEGRYLMEAARRACAELAGTTGSWREFTVLPPPEIGDESIAYDIRYEQTDVYVRVIVTRYGDVISTVADTSEEASVDDLARTVESRLRRVGTLPSPTPDPQVTCEPTAPAQPGVLEQIAAEALLELPDLPPWWAYYPAPPCVPVRKDACGGDAFLGSAADVRVWRGFLSERETIVQEIFVYRDEAGAEKLMEGARLYETGPSCDVIGGTWSFGTFETGIPDTVGIFARHRSNIGGDGAPLPSLLTREGRAVTMITYRSSFERSGDDSRVPRLDEAVTSIIELAITRFREVAPRLNED